MIKHSQNYLYNKENTILIESLQFRVIKLKIE